MLSLLPAVAAALLTQTVTHSATPPPSTAAVPPAVSCGVERWSVKVLADLDAHELATSEVIVQPVSYLIEQKFPVRQWLPRLRRQDLERFQYQVTANLVGAKLEADSDLHIVLADPQDQSKTMIVEIPDPRCMEGAPREAVSQVTEARAAFLKVMKVKAGFTRLKTPKLVTVTGFLFFDKLHGQTGVAPNGAEIHPVLGFQVGAPE